MPWGKGTYEDLMLAWFRRSDGFRWKKYVHTQVIARRARRRDRLQQAAQLASDGVKAAGGAAVAGAGKAAGALGAGIASASVQVADAVTPIARRAGSAARPLNDVLARPSVSKPMLLVAGLVAPAAPT